MTEPEHPHPIFVVDDDHDIRNTLSELLRSEGYKVLSFSNGREALDHLTGGARPCLILLDLMMPVMDGFEFCRRQVQNPQLAEIPVVVITAAGESMTTSVVCKRVLHKPLNFDGLINAVETFC